MENTEDNNEKADTPTESVANPNSTLAIDKDKRLEQYLAYGFGLVFIVVVLVLAIVFPKPEPFQYLVFKIILALAAAGITAFIPGFLQVQVSTIVRAGGAIAVFVIVFFFNPATLVSDSTQSNSNVAKVSTEFTRDITLRDAIKRLAKDDGRIVGIATNCSDSFMNTMLNKGKLQAPSMTMLISQLQKNLTQPSPNESYEVKLSEEGVYEVICKKN